MAVHLEFAPILLPAPAAAHYIGVSESKLRGLAIPRKVLDGKRLYDRRDLDAFANALEYEGGGDAADALASCDEAFGCS